MLQESFSVPPHFEPYRHRVPEHSRIICLREDFSLHYTMAEPTIPTAEEEVDLEGEEVEVEYHERRH